MTEESKNEQAASEPVVQEALARRDFLAGLAKWSTAVIGGIALAGVLAEPRTSAAGAWVNRRGIGGGGWVNRRVGGGAWANAIGGGGAWVNRRIGGGAWVNVR